MRRQLGIWDHIAILYVLNAACWVAMAWFLFSYMPARAEADRRVAEILQVTRDEWQRQNTRIVK